MAAPDALGDILDRIANGEETEGDRQTLRQLLRAGKGQNVQLGKNIANIVDAQGDIQIGDRIYQGASAEAIQKSVRQVLDDFQLKDSPNPQKDWAQLLEQSKENLVAVPDQIGNSVFLPRQVKLEAIETAFETSKVVVLLGSSGCGKTVIAKSWAERELSSSQVIWWNARVRSGFLKALGEKQADDLESETPNDSLSDLAQVDSLISDRLCREREERLSFYHDLYGDWARQRVLLGKTNTLQEYIKPRASSPLWHRAVRLYGLHLLEKNEDAEAWRSALISLYGDNNTPDSTSDLLLEAVIFAANPLLLLEHIWSDLARNNGLLLRRLLIRFIHIATVPNPVILAIASQLGSDLETTAATIQRIPYWPYWLPMLRFLPRHLADVTDLVPKQIAEIADTWLRRGSENWLLRQEAAELALVTAEKLLRSRQTQEFPYGKEELRETIYHAALAGVHELPERVANFALEASFRREVITQEYATDTQSKPLVTRVINDPVYGTYELELPESTWSLIDDPEQNINPIIFRNFSEELEDEEEEPLAWPDGPMRKVDSAFRKVCLTTDALHPLIISNPSIAREVLLAVLIEEPRGHRRSRGLLHDNLRIASNQEWYPPFYTQGPLLSFIKYQPIEGLELILRLVNFATERWADSWRYENQTVPEVTIPILDAEHKRNYPI